MAIQTNIEETEVKDTELVASTTETMDTTPKEDVVAEEQNNSVEYEMEIAKTTEKVNFWVSKSVYDTIKTIAKSERRTQTTVVIEMVRTLLKEDKYEPRPYLPINLRAEKMEVKVSYALPKEMAFMLRERAYLEGRTPTTLFIAAIYRYAKENPIPEEE